MPFLYNTFDNPIVLNILEQVALPTYISDNLKYSIRPYQQEAFKRYIYFDKENFDGKPDKPYHLLYNMATGSGKTLVMAGLILYLHEKGYRNFLFFVNSKNIINKTKDNFLNPQAGKYLFKDKLTIGGREVLIKEVENFEEADTENINIKFTTIQALHIDLNNPKENSITYEDFQDKKMLLIADEAHHLSAATKNDGKLFDNWERTVMRILQQNNDNILLEFTATLDYENKEITDKYQDKVIYKYDLAQFRGDKYSKEINLVRSFYGEQQRIIQALILNLYRQELATSHNINLKPVVLFKAKRTIKESEQNKSNFHQLIADFSPEMVDELRKTSTVAVVEKAFTFFDKKPLRSEDIAKRIKSNFKEENCISANNDKEAILHQIPLNTLEDENNPIRAVFAVQKLNEGWDVLNLFDIVRLYEGQNTGGSNTTIGKTTLSEAQLIGRGARYFPFSLEEGQNQYTRKYDDDISNDLKILEELYYHTKEDSRYISELKKALVQSGIYEDEDKLVTKQLILKSEFKKTDFYQTGKVVYNKKVGKSYDHVESLSDLGVGKRNFSFTLSSGTGEVDGVFGKQEDKQEQETQIFTLSSGTGEVVGAFEKDEDKREQETQIDKIEQKDKAVSEIPLHIVRYALTQNPFFYFDSLKKYFPKIASLTNFITGEDYLGSLEITLKSSKSRFRNISNFDYLSATGGLLQTIESEIKSNLTQYKGSQYINADIHKVFRDKDIKVPKCSERSKGQKNVVGNEPWYVYNANYGTDQEKAFVQMFVRCFEELEQTFDNIYLIRNEREVKITDKSGRTFEPDFLLFCKQKEGEKLTYQVFIEPKGGHLQAHDKWKEDFLKEIWQEKKTIRINTDKYLITGAPFYNCANENEFKKTLETIMTPEIKK